jgi:intracellular septation protein A
VKNLVLAGRALLLDFASTLLFVALYALTGGVEISVVAGILLAFAQLGWSLLHRARPDALQWISLVLVLASGSATLAAHNAAFVMLKPSAIYLLVGGAMLQKGWMTRYMPPVVNEFMPDLVVAFGYVWAGLMFVSAALNLILAFELSLTGWGAVMSVWAIASKAMLFLAQYAVMKSIGRHRRRVRLGKASAIAGAAA